MFKISLLLLIAAVTGYGQLLGGYRRISPREVEKIDDYETVLKSLQSHIDHMYGTSMSLKTNLVCSLRQLVNGLNYKLYYEVKCPHHNDLKTNIGLSGQGFFKTPSFKCEVRFYQSFSGNIDGLHVDCSNVETAFQTCLHYNLQRYRGKRSIVKTMEKVGVDKVSKMFSIFNFHYNKTYSSETSDLYQKKLKTFSDNWKIVEHLNTIERGSAVYGMTKFMDLTNDEFKQHYAPGFTRQLVETPKLADFNLLSSKKLPDEVDWRKKGAVTAVKNQGSCGSCWAFSTTGNIEGQWFLKTGKLVSLSEQELVDCDSLDEGCNGGLPSNAYKSIEKLGGLETESDYPYDAANEHCNIQRSKLTVYVNDSVSLPTDEKKIASWLASHGPISIGINANLMQFYFGGISHPWKMFCNPKTLDHGVLIVGYGVENGTPYWNIKNSWGTDWGEDGYYRIYRGDGSCGVNQMATSALCL